MEQWLKYAIWGELRRLTFDKLHCYMETDSSQAYDQSNNVEGTVLVSVNNGCQTERHNFL